MHAKFSSPTMFTTIFTLAALAGCLAAPVERHKHRHPASAHAAPPGALKERGERDMAAMCQMHREMMGAKNGEERRAMMQERMKGMSPEMMQKHMAMLQEHCR
jgi:hypothetical protein